MILLIDNYDSFVHNLARYFRLLGQRTEVVRSDQITVDEVMERAPRAVVISPGPRAPREAGISLEVVTRLSGRVPILGVCLGHQTIGEAFGGRIVPEAPVHGRHSDIQHDGQGVFEGLPMPLRVARYHSLVIDPVSVPEVLRVSAWTDQGVIMAVSHRTHPTIGVQFHPESVLTDEGLTLLGNFLRIAGVEATCAVLAEEARNGGTGQCR